MRTLQNVCHVHCGVDQSVFDALKDRYGAPWLVELTGIIGHYGLVAGMLNAFEVAPAPDAELLPV